MRATSSRGALIVSSALVACSLAAGALAGCTSQGTKGTASSSNASVETTEARLAALRSVPPNAPLEGKPGYKLVPPEEVAQILGIKSVETGQPGMTLP